MPNIRVSGLTQSELSGLQIIKSHKNIHNTLSSSDSCFEFDGVLWLVMVCLLMTTGAHGTEQL